MKHALTFRNKAQTPVTLYSASVSPTLQPAVRAIEGGAYRKMQSEVFDLAEASASEWLEARQLPGQALWTVDRHSLIGKGADGLHEKKAAASAICFFDALSYIAQYEHKRLFVGDAPSSSLCKLPHYKDVAAALGLPVDIDGAVHPAVDGQVLTDGLFSQDELSVAEKSPPVVIKPQANIADQWPRLSSGINQVSKAVTTTDAPNALTDVFAAYRNEKIAIEESNRRLKKAQDYCTVIWQCINKEISKGFCLTSGQKISNIFRKSSAIFPVLTVLMAGEYFAGEISGYNVLNGREVFPRFLSKLKKAIARLPEGEPKSRLQDFADAVLPTFHFEKAIAIYNLCRDGKISQKRLSQGLDEIEKAGRLAGLGEDKLLQLRSDYQAGHLPEAKTFLKALDVSWDAVAAARRKVENAGAAKLKAIGGPVPR
jgi:hypothetical protein